MRVCTMKHATLGMDRDSNSWARSSAHVTPLDVFYVVESTGIVGERNHRLRSDLYETRPQADVELLRLRRADCAGSYSVWKSATYVEPAEWLHRVVRADGSLILPRLHGLERLSDF
jgi:hypothetical protein